MLRKNVGRVSGEIIEKLIYVRDVWYFTEYIIIKYLIKYFLSFQLDI